MHEGYDLDRFCLAIWADEQESKVVYGFNPGYQMKATYYGPYTKEELLTWAEANGSYELKPVRLH